MTEKPTWELRHGLWQKVLDNIDTVRSVITDAPFSARTHEGALSATGKKGVDQYKCWTLDLAWAFLLHWVPRVENWIVIHTDDVLAAPIRGMMAELELVTFKHVPVIQAGHRQMGDGPAASGHYLVVGRKVGARFTTFGEGGGWGSLPGHYEVPREKGLIKGAKPLNLMEAVVRDYSHAGDLVVDPFTGSGSTGEACRTQHRNFIGAEANEDHYKIAMERLTTMVTTDLFAGLSLAKDGALPLGDEDADRNGRRDQPGHPEPGSGDGGGERSIKTAGREHHGPEHERDGNARSVGEGEVQAG